MFSFITNIFSSPGVIQTVLILTLISVVGLALGRIKIGTFSFGGALVFFVAILAGHLAGRAGIEVNADMMNLAKNFGIMIFVYTLGLQAGPGFVTSLKRGGIKLTLSAILGIVIETVLVIISMGLFNLGAPETVGIYAGSVTNTPMLIAAQEAVGDMEKANVIGAAYAAIYPVSVLLVILCVTFMCKLFPDSARNAKNNEGKDNTVVIEYVISNDVMVGRTVKEIVKDSGLHFVISRIWRNGKVMIPVSDSVIEKSDHLLVICSDDKRAALDNFFGKEEDKDWNSGAIDWDIIDGNMVSKHIRVTKTEVIEHTLGELKLRNKYDVNITRLERNGMSIVPSASTKLQFGDKLTVVGDEKKIKTLGKAMGNEEKVLDEPKLIPLLSGIFLGVVLGCIPFSIPGLSAPVKLGIAGGSIIMGIIVGAGLPLFNERAFTTRSANLMLRQMGITFFFAAVGFNVGGTFVETVFCVRGLTWIALSTGIIIIPLIILGVLNEKVFKIDFASNMGILCGVCTNPNALNFAGNLLHSDSPSETYATIYPVVIFLRIFLAQVLILSL